MTFATDTHAVVYHVTGQKRRLGVKARRAFERADRGLDKIIISFTALEEMMLLSEAGKVSLPMPFREMVVSLMRADNFELGVNDPELLLEAATLTGIRDPYDRMIVAQARMSGLPLITGDEDIQNSGLVRVVWD